MNENLKLFLTTGFSGEVVSLIIRVLIEVLIFLVGTQIIKIIRRIIGKAMNKAKAEKGVTQFVDSFIKVALYVLLLFMIAINLGMDAATVVAVLGSFGVAIGLAVQGSLSNLAGGVLILLTKPFVVGDYIVENSTKTEGEVIEIHIFYTKLKTPEQHIVILPNGNLSNTSIVNISTTRTRRIDLKLSVSYNSDIGKAKAVLEKLLDEQPAVCKDLDHFVYVDELKDSGIILGLRCFVYNEDFWQTKWSLTEESRNCLVENHIEIPYPQLDVHMK